MLCIRNTDPTLVCRIYRMWMTNPQTGTVTGGMGFFSIGNFSGAVSGGAGGGLVSKNDQNSANLSSNLVITTGGTLVTLTTTFKVVGRPTDECAAGGATFDEIINLFPLSLVLDEGYGDSNVQPITLRQNEGLALVSNAASGSALYVGSADIFVELTYS